MNGSALPGAPARAPHTEEEIYIKAQLAAPGDPTRDPTRDPTKAWPDDRPVVDLGLLTIDGVVADGAAAQKKLLFLPGRLTDGIEPSDDPLIAARDAAYAVSFGRRSSAAPRYRINLSHRMSIC